MGDARSRAPELVLFDLDGTLADTFVDLKAALEAAMATRGLAAGNPDAIRARVSEGARAMTRAALGESAGEALLGEVCAEFLGRYQDDVCGRTRLFAGMEEVLSQLEDRGIAIGVVTNKVSRLTDPIIDALGLRHRLSALVSGDSAPRPKPHPDPLLMALDMVPAAAPAAIYIGDAHGDVLAARGAGMQVVAAAYGYLAPGDDPHGWDADGVIAAPVELLGWLDERAHR